MRPEEALNRRIPLTSMTGVDFDENEYPRKGVGRQNEYLVLLGKGR